MTCLTAPSPPEPHPRRVATSATCRPGQARLGWCAVLVLTVTLAGACSSSGSTATGRTTTTAPTSTTAPAPTAKAFTADDTGFATVPDPIPAGTHGDLLRYQPVADAPEGTEWYRIMYLSTTVAGDPTVVTGMLTVPTGDPPEGGWHLATHAHGSTGLADDCAPSHTVLSLPASAAELRVVTTTAAAHGYVVASTDYEGQGGPGRHPFLVGVSEGRAVLDAARAAREFPGLTLPDELAVVGYSQGGHAALWANQIAAEWTPEFHVLGTVAGAPASEVAALIEAQGTPVVDNPQALGIVAGIAAADPSLADDLASILTPDGQATLDAMDRSCAGTGAPTDPGALLTADPTVTEPWKTAMAYNRPGATAGASPVLVFHSREDESVPVDQSLTLLKRLCRAGQMVERRVLDSGSHVAAAVPTYTDGFTWLDGLAGGAEPVSSCPQPSDP